MTFPFEPFPSLYRLVSDDYDSRGMLRRTCSVHGDAFVAHRGCPACAFPILLRSTPLWEPTWIVTTHSGFVRDWVDEGRWFPPLRCGPNAFGDARKRFFGPHTGYRIFSSPLCRCATCLDNAQAIEIMLVGIARAVCEWGEWEHRCWIDRDRWACSCGHLPWWAIGRWYAAVDVDVDHWARQNRRVNEYAEAGYSRPVRYNARTRMWQEQDDDGAWRDCFERFDLLFA